MAGSLVAGSRWREGFSVQGLGSWVVAGGKRRERGASGGRQGGGRTWGMGVRQAGTQQLSAAYWDAVATGKVQARGRLARYAGKLTDGYECGGVEGALYVVAPRMELACGKTARGSQADGGPSSTTGWTPTVAARRAAFADCSSH